MQKKEQLPRLTFSVKETAEILGVSTYLVYEMIKRGEIKCLSFGSRKMISKITLESIVGAPIEIPE